MATNSSVTGGAATAAAHANALISEQLRRVCGHCLRAAATLVVGYSFAVTAWRVGHDPQDLGFVATTTCLLVALLVCLRRAERLTPDSPAADRRRAQAAVWALSTALSCAFAYRVAAVMPLPLAGLIWCMTSFDALTGLYLLVLGRDQQYQALPTTMPQATERPLTLPG